MTNIAIRVDASAQIGIGHVMRCLTLSKMLIESFKCNIIFVCTEDLPVELATMIQSQNYTLHLISKSKEQSMLCNQDAIQTLEKLQNERIAWLIVDHYQLDAQWEQLLYSHVNHILVIDDLANRSHDCDVLLDQNLHPLMNSRYNELVSAHCRLFLGPQYILLRSEFYRFREQREPIQQCKNVLVNFGGSDPTNETEKLLKMLSTMTSIVQNIHFHIVAGPANIRKSHIQSLCALLPNVSYYNEANIAQLLVNTDLAIGAGGVTMWERCFMGVPSLVISVADNQLESVQEAEQLSLIWNMGKSENIQSKQFADFLENVISNVNLLQEQQERCIDFMSYTEQKIHAVVEYMKEEL